ncbi:hypothetical protein [Thalassobacillus sp. CUG 92003]|uniref:anti-sigma-I factor RsgI family protein n=1 Tax=Thalassobacillus sp. CUG 92003 TaxID=2736641 RepID=UPI0015E70AAF|nr:hypothetical protein [Thalassobacillus sp. CUG 92003]
MRKGIIMEHNRLYSILMTEDGAFHKAKPVKHCDIGEETRFEPLPDLNRMMIKPTMWVKNRSVRAAGLAVILLIAFIPLYSWYHKDQAYAYVNIDINPSIGIELNQNKEVMNVIAVNKEAETIVDQLGAWQGRSVEAIAFDLINLSKDEGFITGEKRILIGISYLRDRHDNLSDISQDMEQYLTTHSLGMTVASFEVPQDLHEQAKSENKSMNEIMANTLEDQSGTADVQSSSVEVEDDDKAIIQSFYQEKRQPSTEPDLEKSSDNQPDTSSSMDPIHEQMPVEASSTSRHHVLNRNEKDKEGQVTKSFPNTVRQDTALGLDKKPESKPLDLPHHDKAKHNAPSKPTKGSRPSHNKSLGENPDHQKSDKRNKGAAQAKDKKKPSSKGNKHQHDTKQLQPN